MANTQNGWSVYSNGKLDRSPFPGTSIVPAPGVRSGDVAKVLHYVGSQFDKRVEKLVNPGCWGWNAAVPIPGYSVISNHASGTAIDLNAPKHPWQVKGTFTVKQVEEIRKIVRECAPVVVWGGDWSTVDEMHFEIQGTAAQVRSVARRLNKGDDMLTATQQDHLYRFYFGRSVDASGRKRVGKHSFDREVEIIKNSGEYKRKVKESSEGRINVKDHLFSAARNVYKETTGNFVEVTDKLYKEAK